MTTSTCHISDDEFWPCPDPQIHLNADMLAVARRLDMTHTINFAVTETIGWMRQYYFSEL